ncbi:phage antirepressor KilAC domain-containing protein [Selenomonas sp.]|uniref:phage antirepressor KilAC domain-containing protein n=1 Tax=Selenomonas sp. TaxID=2053611 RepID=UPI002A7587CA|nr:phage antirepressor KilAC domain-containing protein [Selenomonas sp.]MDY3298516.1 phage antirepressor KilAC domain-containing protein [Selenomonas sp.]
MNELIKIETSESGAPCVSGRELHAFLEVGTEYMKWTERYFIPFGFEEGTDFSSELTKSTGGRPAIDHALTIDMAKELCMIQRTERGKQARQYFLQVEKDWNSPQKIMARALALAEKELATIRTTVQVQQQQIAELQPKATYYDLVLQCKNAIPVSIIAKDYGYSARKMNELLNERGVQFKQGKNGPWLLYQKYAGMGYTSTKTQNFPDKNGEMFAHVHMYWTQKGRMFIYDILKKDGILPTIEREQEEVEEAAAE